MTTTTVSPKQITFAATEAKATDTKAGKYEILVINEGQGSSGYYAADVLQQAVEDRIFGAGLHVYLDHPGEMEAWDRPERTVRDLAGVLTTDGIWDEARKGIVAEMQILGPMQPMVEAMWPHVGMSIRAWMESDIQDIDGELHIIVTRLTAAESVDIVTHAGRGGEIIRALESAGVKNFPASPVRENKEVVMPNPITEETAKSLVDSLTGLNAHFEAQATAAAAAEAAKGKEPEANPVDVAFSLATKLAESTLPANAYDRVRVAVKAGVDVDEAIKAEADYVDAIRKESGTSPSPVGKVTESGSGAAVSEADNKAWADLINQLGSREGV